MKRCFEHYYNNPATEFCQSCLDEFNARSSICPGCLAEVTNGA